QTGTPNLGDRTRPLRSDRARADHGHVFVLAGHVVERAARALSRDSILESPLEDFARFAGDLRGRRFAGGGGDRRVDVSFLPDHPRMADLESKSNQISYRRVGGMRRTLTLSRAALFTADDHFLLCDYRSGFTERYKRFYFRDIEAIIIRKTNGWLFWIMAWILIGLIFLMIGTSASWNKWVTLAIEGTC